MQLEIKTFKNYYCDALSCALSEFMTIENEEDLLKVLSLEDAATIVDYVVVKNKLAGASELYIKVPYPALGIDALNKFDMQGKEIISARLIQALSAKHFVGGRLMLIIEDLLDYNESALLEISDFCGQADVPIMINLGRDLQEVGKLVNRYGKSPGKLLEDFGFLDRECYIYGMNFIDKDDQKLLNDYDATLILSPRSDGEEGKGAINLYNFIYNHLKFGFSSGKCYNIDMLAEGRLAILNTNNLMYESGLVGFNDIMPRLESENGEILLNLDVEIENNAFNEKISLKNDELTENYVNLRKKVQEIVKRIKE